MPSSRLRRLASRVRASTTLTALAIYTASRVFTTALLAGVFLVATAQGWSFASHRDPQTLLTFLGSWDGSAYHSIAHGGYPSQLPHDAFGRVLPNPWAFLPLYPAIVGAVARPLGLDFYTLAPVLSLLFGAVAAVLLAHLTARGARSPSWAVVLFCVGPMSFVLQIAYAESLFLALALGCLLAMSHRRYAISGLLGVAAAATRPGALALALTLAVVAIVLVRRRELSGLQVVTAAAATVAIGLAGLAWPIVAAAVTGERSAYLDTEIAFQRPLLGDDAHFTPLTPWFAFAFRFLGVPGLVLVTVVLAGAAVLLLGFARGRAPLESRVFVASYALYLVAVFLPQQSTPRLLLPLVPALGDERLRPRRRGARVGVVAGLAALQIPAVVGLWFLTFP